MVHPNQAEVMYLRVNTLDMTRREFASLFAVEIRTVARWESHIDHNNVKGTPRVMILILLDIFREADDARRDELVAYIQSAVDAGGLGVLMHRLITNV